MRSLLFADGEVGLQILRFLLDQYREDVQGVVVTDANDLLGVAESAGVNVHVYSTPEDFLAWAPSGCDLGILAWWPKILKKSVLNAARLGFINTHPSLLPHNRGKHYNFWAIVEQAPFGVTLHWVDEGIDTGHIVAQQPIPYGWTDTGETLYRKAQESIFTLFSETYPLLRTGNIESSRQLGPGSFHYASELESASHIDLDAQYQARHLLNLLRARTFSGYPSCWFVDDGEKYEVTVNIRKLKV